MRADAKGSRRALAVGYALSAPAALVFSLERKTRSATRVACPTSQGAPDPGPFRRVLMVALPADRPSSRATSNGGRTGAASLRLPKALAPGVYRLVTTATTTDGRIAKTTDEFNVLEARR